jgi:DNA polymerase III sliding clamp (beta) subunit (PCNA family)
MDPTCWYLLRYCSNDRPYSVQELAYSSEAPLEQLQSALGLVGVELPDGQWLIAPGCDEYPKSAKEPLPPGLQDVPAELRQRYWTEPQPNRSTMQVTTTRSEIARALSLLTRTTAKKGLHVLAGTMKLRAVSDPEEQDCLLCYATDGIAFAGTTVLAEVKDVGEVVVPSQHLERILAAVPEGEVKLHATEKNLTISAGKGCRFRVPILGIPYPREAEFPDSGNNVELPSVVLREAIRRVEACRLVDGTQPAFMGVHLRSGADSLVATTVSGHHAARTVMRLPEGAHLPIVWSCLLPNNILRSLTDLTEEEGPIAIAYSNAVYLANNDSLIGCALPGGDFPDPSFMFRSPDHPWFRVGTESLDEGLKIVSAASSSRDLVVQLSVEEDGLVLESQPSSKDLEEYTVARTVVPLVEVMGSAPKEPMQASVLLLRDAMRGMSPVFMFSYNEERIRFSSSPEPGSAYEGLAESVVMPIHATNRGANNQENPS